MVLSAIAKFPRLGQLYWFMVATWSIEFECLESWNTHHNWLAISTMSIGYAVSSLDMISDFWKDILLNLLYWGINYIQYIIHFKGISESRSVMSDSLWPRGLYNPWNSPGQNTGVGSLSLLQGIFPTWGSTGVSCVAGGFFTSWATGEACLSPGTPPPILSACTTSRACDWCSHAVGYLLCGHHLEILNLWTSSPHILTLYWTLQTM